jgi:CHRD domain
VVASALFTQMTGANERPNPVTTTANGAAVFTRNGSTMNYVVTYQGIASNPTGMHIHAPAGPTANSGIIVDLMRTPIASTSGVATGSFTATDIRGISGQPPTSLDSLTSLLRNGQGYVNVHSTAFPAGEIRGQLAPPAS